MLRQRHSELLAKATDKLEQIKIKPNSLSIMAFGAAQEPIVRMARIVHDWGNDAKPGLVRQARYVEIDSTCVPDTTSSSVPVEKQLTHTPQDLQSPDSNNIAKPDTTG